MLKASAIQKPTKFQLVHWRWLLGTGCRSSLASYGIVSDVTRKSVAYCNGIFGQVSYHELHPRHTRIPIDGKFTSELREHHGYTDHFRGLSCVERQ